MFQPASRGHGKKAPTFPEGAENSVCRHCPSGVVHLELTCHPSTFSFVPFSKQMVVKCLSDLKGKQLSVPYRCCCCYCSLSLSLFSLSLSLSLSLCLKSLLLFFFYQFLFYIFSSLCFRLTFNTQSANVNLYL